MSIDSILHKHVDESFYDHPTSILQSLIFAVTTPYQQMEFHQEEKEKEEVPLDANWDCVGSIEIVERFVNNLLSSPIETEGITESDLYQMFTPQSAIKIIYELRFGAFSNHCDVDFDRFGRRTYHHRKNIEHREQSEAITRCNAQVFVSISDSNDCGGNESNDADHIIPGYTLNLNIAILQAVLGPFLFGWNIGLLNVPQDVIQNDVTKMSEHEWALLNSLISVGGMVGSFTAGCIQDKIGRKKAMLIMDVVFIVSAAVSYFYANGMMGFDLTDPKGFVVLWSGRFIAGLGIGAETAIVPTYLEEIAPPRIRGTIGTSHQFMICLGILVANIVGYSEIMGGGDTWSLLFIPNAIPLLQILTAFTFPESPKWLYRQGMVNEARKALERLRMKKDVGMEMNMIQKGCIERKSFLGGNSHDQPLLDDETESNSTRYEVTPMIQVAWKRSSFSTKSSDQKKIGTLKQGNKALKWAVIIAIMLMFMQMLCGINAIDFYSSFILKNAGITSEKGMWLGTVGINTASLLSVAIPVYFIDRVGRRVLLVSSGILVMMVSIGVSLVIIMDDMQRDKVFSYASIGFLILFMIGFQIGLGPIPWLMMVEVSPMQYRGPIVSAATMTNWLCMAVIGQFSAILMSSDIKMFGYAAFSLFGIVFTLRYLPETNGKTTAEIQKALDNI